MNQPQKIAIGTYRCWLLPDGEFDYPGATLLPEQAAPPLQIPVPYTALLVDTGSARILIDTGAGSLGPRTGRLMGSLIAAGITPNDIDTVVVSHAHPDHIAGLPKFPGARVVMTRREFDFWESRETAAKLAAGELYGLGDLEHLMRTSVCENLLPVQDRLRFLDEPTELAAGVLVFDVPGHTPGHAAVLISSGRQQLLYAGDAVIHPKQFEHPDWTSAFDLDRNETATTRRKLLDRVVADHCLLAAFHLPGGIGVVEPFHSNFHWSPATSGTV
jgi:glyoxylase-like metal-dependent hydrolase (beta-lactamase superfamily II)